MQGKRNKTIISRITENRNFGLLLGLAVLLIIAEIGRASCRERV